MKKIYLPLLVVFLLSCHKNERKDEITRLVTEWQGKEIVFPENMAFTRFVTDTANYSAFTLDTVNNPTLRAEYKILLYVDSTGCSECKLKLPQWQEFMSQVDSLAGGQIPFLFVLHPKDIEEIHLVFLLNYFYHPACMDMDDELNRLNRFPQREAFHAFLLDKKNRVAVIGNPMSDSKIRELYLDQIKNNWKK